MNIISLKINARARVKHNEVNWHIQGGTIRHLENNAEQAAADGRRRRGEEYDRLFALAADAVWSSSSSELDAYHSSGAVCNFACFFFFFVPVHVRFFKSACVRILRPGGVYPLQSFLNVKFCWFAALWIVLDSVLVFAIKNNKLQ